MAEVKPAVETFAKIKVLGVGGSGNSVLQRMVQTKMGGVEFIAINTDAQALHQSNAHQKIHIGPGLTGGLGAGMDPQKGREAAEESREELYEAIKGSDMVFVTCGLGGGTGSGAGPIVAELAKESGALTVGFVTKPFQFEGQARRTIAEEALAELAERVDALVVVPNDRVMQVIDRKTSLLDAFKVVDDVLRQGVQGITDIITKTGMVNVDFADVQAIMKDSGSALMGIGTGSGETRAVEAARAAIDSPLLEVQINGAKGVIFNITGGSNIGMYELEEAANIITEHADPNCKVIFGAVMSEDKATDEISITVIATGFETAEKPLHQAPPKATNIYDKARAPMGGFHRVGIGGSVPGRDVHPVKPQERQDRQDQNEIDRETPTFIRRKMNKSN